MRRIDFHDIVYISVINTLPYDERNIKHRIPILLSCTIPEQDKIFRGQDDGRPKERVEKATRGPTARDNLLIILLTIYEGYRDLRFVLYRFAFYIDKLYSYETIRNVERYKNQKSNGDGFTPQRRKRGFLPREPKTVLLEPAPNGPEPPEKDPPLPILKFFPQK